MKKRISRCVCRTSFSMVIAVVLVRTGPAATKKEINAAWMSPLTVSPDVKGADEFLKAAKGRASSCRKSCRPGFVVGGQSTVMSPQVGGKRFGYYNMTALSGRAPDWRAGIEHHPLLHGWRQLSRVPGGARAGRWR